MKTILKDVFLLLFLRMEETVRSLLQSQGSREQKREEPAKITAFQVHHVSGYQCIWFGCLPVSHPVTCMLRNLKHVCLTQWFLKFLTERGPRCVCRTTSSYCQGGVTWGTQGMVSDAALRSPCQRWMTGECLKRMRAGPLQAEEKPSLATGMRGAA